MSSTDTFLTLVKSTNAYISQFIGTTADPCFTKGLVESSPTIYKTGNSFFIDYGQGTANKFRFGQGNGSSANPVFFTSANTYSANQWHHVAVTNDTNGVRRMFINGVQDGTQTYTSASLDSGTTFIINGVYDNNGLGSSGGSFYGSNYRFIRGSTLYTSNFTPPTSTEPSLLSHDDVTTLFHEFGHGLQHMLTKIDYLGVSGINGVEWDAVELPSQFMENWCWEQEALALISGHYQTGEPLPDTLFNKMLAAKNFQAGMMTVRQLEFSLFDFRIHKDYDPEKGARIYPILEQVRAQVAVINPPKFNRFAHSFSHIFAGGYAAGYYSYKWAEVLSSDAFSLFEEKGIFNPETGKLFLTTILETGGSEDAMALFIKFRGRKPTIDALLKHNGIAA